MRHRDHQLSLSHSRCSESDLRMPLYGKADKEAAPRSSSVASVASDEELRSVKYCKSDRSLDHISEDIGSSCSSLSFSSSSVGESAASSCGYGSFLGYRPGSSSLASSPPSRSETPCPPATSAPPKIRVGSEESIRLLPPNSPESGRGSQDGDEIHRCNDYRPVVDHWNSLDRSSRDQRSSVSHIPAKTVTTAAKPFSRENSTIKCQPLSVLFYPMNSLENELLLSPRLKLPLRRYQSVIDLKTHYFGTYADEACTNISATNQAAAGIRRRNSDTNLDSLDMSEEEPDWCRISSDSSDDGYGSHDSASVESLPSKRPESNLYELKKLRQRNYIRNKRNQVNWSPRIRARLLIERIKLHNPVSVAMQLTAIDKDLYLQINPMEIVKLILGKRYNQNSWQLNGVRTLLEFGEQIMQIVANVIQRETTTEARARKIAAFIEVSCVLRKIRNWNSLTRVIKALQAPSIYFMLPAWLEVQQQFPIHFRDFIKLSAAINRLDHSILKIPTSKPSIPCLHNMISLLKIQCAAKFDICENQPKWIEPPSIAGWINRQIAGSLSVNLERLENKDNTAVASLLPNTNSLLPQDDPIRYISPSLLPIPWTHSETHKISVLHWKILIPFIEKCFNQDLKLVKKYKMRRTIDNL